MITQKSGAVYLHKRPGSAGRKSLEFHFCGLVGVSGEVFDKPLAKLSTLKIIAREEINGALLPGLPCGCKQMEVGALAILAPCQGTGPLILAGNCCRRIKTRIAPASAALVLSRLKFQIARYVWTNDCIILKTGVPTSNTVRY